jgi:hypothetical protein
MTPEPRASCNSANSSDTVGVSWKFLMGRDSKRPPVAAMRPSGILTCGCSASAIGSFPGLVRLMAMLGCASTRHHEETGEYVDDSVITTKVKAAIFNEPGLKVSEVGVATFKGKVQLSGFVSSRADIKDAVRVASAVDGVKSVTNGMQLK